MKTFKYIIIISLFSSLSCSAQKGKQNFSAKELVNYTKSFIGTPHKMGGLDKNGIDCSGLVKVSFGKFGIELPHNSHLQSDFGVKIEKMEDLQLGDIVFFERTYSSKYAITHSGIYIGNNEFIHTSSKRGVIISKVNDPYYWKEKFVFATRMK